MSTLDDYSFGSGFDGGGSYGDSGSAPPSDYAYTAPANSQPFDYGLSGDPFANGPNGGYAYIPPSAPGPNPLSGPPEPIAQIQSGPQGGFFDGINSFFSSLAGQGGLQSFPYGSANTQPIYGPYSAATQGLSYPTTYSNPFAQSPSGYPLSNQSYYPAPSILQSSVLGIPVIALIAGVGLLLLLKHRRK